MKTVGIKDDREARNYTRGDCYSFPGAETRAPQRVTDDNVTVNNDEHHVPHGQEARHVRYINGDHARGPGLLDGAVKASKPANQQSNQKPRVRDRQRREIDTRGLLVECGAQENLDR